MTAVKTRNSTKAPRTKELIFETAISLFQKQGFEQTTMRDIAAVCEVSLGNAYYYFESKEHLVFALYERTLELQFASLTVALASEKNFGPRFQAALQSNLRVLQPYRTVLRAMFKLAADPDSSLNPFGEGTKNIRERAQQMFRLVVEGSSERMSESVRKELPELLWLSYMGLILYWLHDKSPNSTRTQKLVTRTAEIFGLLLTVISLPMMDRLWQMLLNLLNELR